MSNDSQDTPLFFEHHVFFCINERADGHPRGCCKAKGSETLRNYMKARAKEMGLKRVRINSAGCLDRCELGPTVVIYPEGVWYRCGSIEDVDSVLNEHLVKGNQVSDLILRAEDI